MQINQLKKKLIFSCVILFIFFVMLTAHAHKKAPVKPVKVERLSAWKAYNLSDEGNYVLRLSNQKGIPLKALLNNVQVYIPSGALIREDENLRNKSIFIPSTGEYLVQISLLKLLREEGFNISLRSHSFVYIVSKKSFQSAAALEIYKIGPAKPFLSQSF